MVPMTWFGGRYKDDRPENFFAQIATDPDEYLKVASDKIVPPDQVLAWQRDRAGALVDVTLANKYGWKIGDKITLLGTIFQVNPELTIRGIYHRDPPQNSLYFNAKYLEESVAWFKGQAGWYGTQLAQPERCGAGLERRLTTCSAIRLSERRPRARKLSSFDFVASLGNVKAFILGICGAVVFAILLVSAQYHGHVGAQPNPRSGRAENAGIHAPARAFAVRGRGGGVGGGGRSVGSIWGDRADSLVDALPGRDRHSAWI